jgi:hypothetical protein
VTIKEESFTSAIQSNTFLIITVYYFYYIIIISCTIIFIKYFLPILFIREKCNFFKWADEVGTTTDRTTYSRNQNSASDYKPKSGKSAKTSSKKQTSFSSKAGSSSNFDSKNDQFHVSNITCSRCHQLGHYSRNCPNKF